MNEAVWRVELLGGLRVVGLRGGDVRTPVTRFRTQKTAALLAYLALNRRPHKREVLQDVFWPDETTEAGRNALRVALHSLRKQLEPAGVPYNGVLFADRSTVYLNPDACLTDVAEFEQTLHQAARTGDPKAALQAALALYSGELLPGFYDDWVFKERERLQELFVRTALQLSRYFLDAGQFDQALSPARRAASADPRSEEACRLLMQAHARLGTPETARQQYYRTVNQNGGAATTLITTNFANFQGGNTQGFGGSNGAGGYVTSGAFAPQTGAAEINTLYDNDSVYRFSFTFADTSSSFAFNFIDGQNQGIGDESMGYDNVRVTTNAVAGGAAPEPGTLVLLGGGLPLMGGGLVLRLRRRRLCLTP